MGGGESQSNATLCAIKTTYRLFGIPLFFKTKTALHKPYSHNFFCKSPLGFKLQNTPDDFYLSLWGGDLGEYIATNPNIENEIFALCKGLSEENKMWLLRQIHRERCAFENKSWRVDNLTQSEKDELVKIYTEFYPNIFKLGENLYFYNGYFFPTNFCEISVMWHKHSLSVLEPSTLAKMRGKDFIDVGACIGDSAVLFEREFCDKNIYTFEPTKENFRLLKRTLELNNSKRIIPVNKALGAESGSMEIHYRSENIGGSSALFSNENTVAESVEITTLDEFVKTHKIEVGFIKVDIEGFEMEFLKGAKETICAQKPAMLLSIYHQPSDYFGIKPLIESWNLGYTFKIHKGVDLSVTGETALFCEIVE